MGAALSFFSNLHRRKATPPEVDWLVWEKSEPHLDYLARAQSIAEKAGSYLAFRRGGGGACIGIVTPRLLHKDRRWSLYGIGSKATVASLLKDLGWEVKYRATEPFGADQPWQFYGKLSEESQVREHSYEIPGANGIQDLRIVMRFRRRKRDEDEVIVVKHRWWDGAAEDASAVQPTDMDVSTTQEDTQEDGAKGDGSTISPLKKKPRAVGASGSQATSPAFHLRQLQNLGPGRHWRLWYWKNREFRTVPNSPEEFIEACRRKNRRCCGVTLQMVASLKRITNFNGSTRCFRWLPF